MHAVVNNLCASRVPPRPRRRVREVTTNAIRPRRRPVHAGWDEPAAQQTPRRPALAAAVDALAGALTLACPQGYVRVFADEGPPMAALLGRLVAA